MKKTFISILVLMLLCVSVNAPAESSEAITLEVNTARLPYYAADDAFVKGFRGEAAANTLPVLLIPVKKSIQVQTAVKPGTVKNKKTVLTAADETLVQIRGNAVTGLKAGETVLTVASEQDPSVTVQYLAVVYNPVNRITLTADKYIAVGQTVAVTAAMAPEDATVKDVLWSSSDERIATVDATGNVTGVMRGNVRITATPKDGGKVTGNCYLQVTQNAEELTLDKQEITVDAGRVAMLKATVLPNNTNDKSVEWTSSDESIATVNAYGRVTGVAKGDCEIICTSKTNSAVWAKAAVHVQQPVKKVSFNAAPALYVNETGTLTWNIEPADASNPAIKLTSGNEKILKISEDGTMTGISAGQTTVNAVTADGSNRRAQVKVNVMQHLESAKMKRKVAYIDYGESATASAVLKPTKYVNHNMTWTSEDETIAKVKPVKNAGDHVKITGVGRGETTITGVTEDGSITTSMKVKVGNWSRATKISKAEIDGKGNILVKVRNMSKELTLTYIKLEIEAFDSKGKPVAINKKDGSNVVTATYSRVLDPGDTTLANKWKLHDYDDEKGFQRMTVRVVEYQINDDWVKKLRPSVQPTYEYKPGK